METALTGISHCCSRNHHSTKTQNYYIKKSSPREFFVYILSTLSVKVTLWLQVL